MTTKLDIDTAWAYAELVVDNIEAILDEEVLMGELATKSKLRYARDRAKQVRDFLFQLKWQNNDT